MNYHNAVIVCRESDLDCSITRPAADEGASKEDFKVQHRISRGTDSVWVLLCDIATCKCVLVPLM